MRLNPDELHINDPDYYDEVFNMTNGKVQKPWKIANAFGPHPAVGVLERLFGHPSRSSLELPNFQQRSSRPSTTTCTAFGGVL